MRKKPIVINILASILIIGAGAWGIKQLLTSSPKAEVQKPTSSGLLVQTTTLQPTTHTLKLSTIGTVEAAQKGSLSSKVSGRIQEIHPLLTPGTFVRKGTVLIQIDPIDYQAALAQLKAQLSSAKAALMIEEGQQASARKELELSGVKTEGLSRSLLLREPQLAQAKAAVENLEASLMLAKHNLEACQIKAPFDGIITQKKAEIGNYVGAQSALAEMVATQNYWLVATVPSTHLPFLSALNEQALQALPIQLSQNNTPLHVDAHIQKLLPELDSTTKQPKILLSIDNPLGLHTKATMPPVLLGETLEVAVELKRFEGIYVVPLALLRANDTLWLMDDAHTLRIQKVNVIAKEKEVALVADGLTPNDKIITTYLTTAVAGMALQEMAAPSPKQRKP